MTNGKWPGDREQRRLAEDRDDDRIGDDAGEDRRDQRVGLEVVAVEHLDRQQRGAERRAEHRRRCRPRRRRPSGCAARRASTRSSQPHIEPSAPPICMVGPSRPPEPPVPSVKIDASALTQATRLRTTPSWLVEGVDHRVAAAAAGLGRQLRDDAARQRADRGQQREQPGAEMRGCWSARRRKVSPWRAQRVVAAELLEHRVAARPRARRRTRRPSARRRRRRSRREIASDRRSSGRRGRPPSKSSPGARGRRRASWSLGRPLCPRQPASMV